MNVDLVLRAVADYPDPPGTRYINDTTFFVTENFTVETNDSWVVQNSTFIFNCSADGELGIIVEPDGYIEFRNGSLLTINKTSSFSK